MNMREDLSSLLALMSSLQQSDEEAAAKGRHTSMRNITLYQGNSSQATDSQDHDIASPSSSLEPIDFNLVDSLTLVRCKKLIIPEEEHSHEDSEESDYKFLAQRSSMLQMRNRSGVRRGQENEGVYIVRTKSC